VTGKFSLLMFVILQIIFHSCKLFSKEKEKKRKKKKKRKEKRKKKNKEGIEEKMNKAPCNNNDLIHTV
jgi:type III secretory pathway component EscV